MNISAKPLRWFSRGNVISWLLLFVPASAQPTKISELIRVSEVLEKSCHRMNEAARQVENYTSKWRRSLREKQRDGKIKEESELREIYFRPGGASFKRRQRTDILLEKNGKPTAPEKIAQERLRAGKNLDKYEKEASQSPSSFSCDEWGVRFWRIKPLVADEWVGVIVKELLENCELDDAQPDKLRNRDAVSLRFRPRPAANFRPESAFLAQFTGRVWIDTADQILVRLVAYPQTKTFDQSDSDYLLESASLALDYFKTPEGFWLWRYSRINGLDYPGALLWLTQDLRLEMFDFQYFKVAADKEKLKIPDKP